MSMDVRHIFIPLCLVFLHLVDRSEGEIYTKLRKPLTCWGGDSLPFPKWFSPSHEACVDPICQRHREGVQW